MSISIPETYRDLLNAPTNVTITTLMPDHTPQSSVVWCKLDGDDILVSITVGQQKELNIRHRGKATVLAFDPENPYRYIEVRGNATVEDEGNVALIDELAKAYRGVDSYYGDIAPAEMASQETRIVCRITPTRVRPFPPQS